MIERYDRALWFYGWSLALPWILWLCVAWMSRQPVQGPILEFAQPVLGMLGLCAPMGVAAWRFRRDPALWTDLRGRLVWPRGVPVVFGVLAAGLTFGALVLAQVLSLGLGHGLEQFHVSGQPSFSSTVASPWFILLFAPVVEELAWHSYGTDALVRRWNLFKASMIFAAYWVIWHLPLSLIQGYYHANVMAEGWIYSLNFIGSLFVFVVLMNWLYYRTRRNVLVTVVFHLAANVGNEIFATHPDSKVIQTALLLGIAGWVLYQERALFFRHPLPQVA